MALKGGDTLLLLPNAKRKPHGGINMKPYPVLLIVIAALLMGCGGIARMNASRQSDSQLKLRLSQTNRELQTYRFGEDAIHETNMLQAERDAIERELLSRCEAGDQDACLPQFGR